MDRQAIWDVYNETIKEYKISGNALEALSKGAKYGMIKANGKTDSGTYRHVNNHFYWSNFFENTIEKQGYRDKETMYSKYANGWADFEDSLKRGRECKISYRFEIS